MGGDGRVQAGFVTESTHHPLDGTIINRLLRRLTAKQPPYRTVALEVTPQDIQQSRREQDIAILGTLALTHTDLHLCAVNVLDLKVYELVEAQTRCIEGHQDRLLFEVRRSFQQTSDFRLVQHPRQLSAPPRQVKVLKLTSAVQYVDVEEFQSTESLDHRRSR